MPEGPEKHNWRELPRVPHKVKAENLPSWARPDRPDLEIPEFPASLPGLSKDDQAKLDAHMQERERAARDCEVRNLAAREAEATVSRLLADQQGVVAQQQQEDRQRLAPFHAYLDSLRELSDESQPEARTELKLQLFRLEDSGGPKPRKIYCQELTLDQAEVKTMGDPAFERRTQDYAERAGRFGRYEWRMKGWALGELTLDTSTTVNVEPPPGYVPPPNLIQEDKPKVDPMEGMNGALDMVGRVAALFVGGKTSTPDPVEMRKLEALAYDQGNRAGITQGRYEAEREHRKELDDLRERHRRELEEAERRGLDRGKVEGSREKSDELTPRLWQLEHEARGEGGPSMVSEVVGALGGPETLQSLVGAVVANMNQPRTPAPRRRPAPQGQAAVVPLVPQQAPRPVAANPSGEPSRAEHLEAMNMLEEAVMVLEEQIPNEEAGHAAQLHQLKELMEAFHGEGLKDGPLAAWWLAWDQRWKPSVEAVIRAAEDNQPEPGPEPEGEPVNLEALRALLIEALDEGKDDSAILTHLESTIPADIQAGWRKQIDGWPIPMLAGMIGQGQHQGRLTRLLEAFKAGQ